MTPAEPAQPADVLDRQVALLVNQVGHWTAPRWTAPAAAGGTDRADLLHRLVQHVADLAADTELRPRRVVPRLDNDLALPDQLRVVAADLRAAAPPPALLTEAAAEVAATRQAL